MRRVSVLPNRYELGKVGPILGWVNGYARARRVAQVNTPDREHFHVGCRHAGPLRRLLCSRHSLRLCLRTTLDEGKFMIFDYSLAGLVSIGLLFYLTYALLRPERF
jgi:K+-transporting ATPase KdpF subunit